MGYYTYEDRRQVIRYLFYAVFLLILWGLLVADVMYMFGMWDGSPTVYAIMVYYMAVVTFCLGPVFMYETRLWHQTQRRRAELAERWKGYRRIRLTCYGCGWQRTIGYTGEHGNGRALIHIKPAKSACNVLSAVVLKAPADEPIEKQLAKYPYFRDISYDVHTAGSRHALRPYRDMLRHRPCPRCKKTGKIDIDLWHIYRKESLTELVRHRSWRVINRISTEKNPD